MSFVYSCLDSYFRITERGTSLGTEFRAGTASFFTLSYLLLVNPQIMAEAGVAHDDAVVATALSAAVSCFIVGFLGNLPFGTAPGIGLSAYLSYSLVQAGLCSLEDALTACFTSGIVLAVVALTGFTTFLMKVVPECVKYGIVVGMGLLIAMIGMVSVHLIVPKDDTLIGLGDMSDLALQLTMVGMLLVGTLIYWDVKGGILIGIAVIAVAQWWIDSDWPTEIAHYPVFNNNNYITPSVMWDSDKAPLLWTAVGVFLLICVFDISGVLFGLATLGGLIRNDGHIPGNIWVFIASATGTITASFFGSTPIICCVETAAGIKEGGRTGLTAITIGLYFMLSLFLAPLFSAIPNDATAPVLILVGVMMMGESAKVEWHDMSQALPAFLTLILMPLTYDITNGMIFGLAAAAGFYFTTGQFFADMKKACCSKSEEEDEQFEDASEHPAEETTSLLLQDDGNVQSHRNTIEKAKQLYSPGSERGVDYGAILY